MSDQNRRSAIAFLKTAIAYYGSLGVKVERVMTDNGSCYKSFAFRRACRRLGLRHQLFFAWCAILRMPAGDRVMKSRA